MSNFVRLNEKFKAEGLLPVKLVTKKPSHNFGYNKNMIKLKETGRSTPSILITDLIILNSNFLVFRSNLINNRNGIMNMLVGLIIILMPKIMLAKKLLDIVSRLRNISSEAKMKKVM